LITKEEMMNPQHAYISGPRMDHAAGLMMSEPHVGDPMQLILENGKMMRTTPVRSVSRNGDELVVETQNSEYRVELVPAS
jgi:hypothetical protein